MTDMQEKMSSVTAILDQASGSIMPEQSGAPEMAIPLHPLFDVIQISTSFIFPPIPLRQYDWMAYVDPESGPFGHGATEEEAKADLLSHMVDSGEAISQMTYGPLPLIDRASVVCDKAGIARRA
jgi:hypothetical protein